MNKEEILEFVQNEVKDTIKLGISVCQETHNTLISLYNIRIFSNEDRDYFL